MTVYTVPKAAGWVACADARDSRGNTLVAIWMAIKILSPQPKYFIAMRVCPRFVSCRFPLDTDDLSYRRK